MVVTRSIIPDHFTHLQEWNDVIIGGWGKTGKRLTEPETSKLLKDCEILLVSYENITEKMIIESHGIRS